MGDVRVCMQNISACHAYKVHQPIKDFLSLSVFKILIQPICIRCWVFHV